MWKAWVHDMSRAMSPVRLGARRPTDEIFFITNPWEQVGLSFHVNLFFRVSPVNFAVYINLEEGTSRRKQPTFGDATTGFPAKWRLRNERRNSILITRHYPDLSSASDWLKHDQSEVLSRSGQWHVTSMEFLRSFLRRHFAGKPVVALWNVGCFSSWGVAGRKGSPLLTYDDSWSSRQRILISSTLNACHITDLTNLRYLTRWSSLSSRNEM